MRGRCQRSWTSTGARGRSQLHGNPRWWRHRIHGRAEGLPCRLQGNRVRNHAASRSSRPALVYLPRFVAKCHGACVLVPVTWREGQERPSADSRGNMGKGDRRVTTRLQRSFFLPHCRRMMRAQWKQGGANRFPYHRQPRCGRGLDRDAARDGWCGGKIGPVILWRAKGTKTDRQNHIGRFAIRRRFGDGSRRIVANGNITLRMLSNTTPKLEPDHESTGTQTQKLKLPFKTQGATVAAACEQLPQPRRPDRTQGLARLPRARRVVPLLIGPAA